MTNSFTNGTTADGPAVSTNFNDLVSALTDGTKTLTVAAVVSTTGTFTTLTPTTIAGTPSFSGSPTFTSTSTFTGTATFNGNVVLGNATTDTVTVAGELKGSRVILTSQSSLATAGSAYLIGGPTGTATYDTGFIMPRAGSIVGLSVLASCSGFTNDIAFTIQVLKNGSNVLESGSLTIAAANTNYSDYTTQARGSDTFAAGDRISLFQNTTNTGTMTGTSCLVLLELQFDS